MHDHSPPTDERLLAGIAHQQELLRTLTEDGATVLGWKAGLGAPAARAALSLSAPLIGMLLDTTQHPTGATLSIAGWERPLAEAEVAVRLGRDVPVRSSETDVLAAVDALAPAIELVDLAPPPEDPATVLAGNIFHRAWLTGPFTPVDGALDLDVRTVTVHDDLHDPLVVDALETLTGPASSVLVETARMAGRIGRGLRAGDIVLLGSVITARTIAPGRAFRVALSTAEVEVSFS